MNNKLKKIEGEHILKLNKYSVKLEESSKKADASSVQQKESEPVAREGAANAGKFEAWSTHTIKEAPSLPGGSGSGGNESAFDWLKVIDDASGDRPSGSAAAAFRKRYAEPPAFLSADWTPARQDEGDGDDLTAERSLARRLAARFDDAIQSPPQTLTSALKPYLAAAGFFVAVTGIFAFYMMPSRHSAQATGAANVLKPASASETALPETGAPIAGKVAAGTQASELDGRKPSMQRIKVDGAATRTSPAIPAIGSAPAEKRGWIPKQSESDTPETQSATGQPPSGEHGVWSNTLENLKQFAGEKPKTREGGRESQRYLDALEAWQNAKKAP